MPPVLDAPSPLLALGLVLLVGVFAGGLAWRARLPAVTGQILAGIAVGPVALHLVDEATVRRLQPLTHFAIGLMAVTIGAHLDLRSLRNAGRRLALLLLCEALLIPPLVYGAMRLLPGVPGQVSLMLGAIAVSTAPATILAVVRDARAKGVFVKTLVAAVALNNFACIVLFEAASSALGYASGGPTLGRSVAGPLVQVGLALALGGGVALLHHVVARVLGRDELGGTAGMLVILLTAGLADYLRLSPLLSCLFLGVVQTNVEHVREGVVDSVFRTFEPSIMAVFFMLAGMELRFDYLATAGLAAVVYFTARLLGKLFAVRLAMELAGAPAKLKRYLGLALVPQAGLAIGLVLLAEERRVFEGMPGAHQLFVATVLTVVMANEIVGPVLARIGLRQSAEVGRDRQRLIDFLQEENILVDFEAPDMETAIRRLVDHMMRSHRLPGIDRDELLASVLERERTGSTCLGQGLAVPHGILPDGRPMVGVLAVSREGLVIAPTGCGPVYFMVLLATSSAERERHLQVLATLARTVGQSDDIRRALRDARSAAHAYEILHGEETDSFNWYLKE